MIPLGPVVARSRMKAARAAVWALLMEADRRSEWWPNLRLDPGLGGAIAVPAGTWGEQPEDVGGEDRNAAAAGEAVDRVPAGREAAAGEGARGEVDVWVEGHALGFTWKQPDDPRATAVLLTLRTQGPETGVTVTETGFDALPAPAERAAQAQQRWERLLAALSAAIDTAAAAGTLGESAQPTANPAAAEPDEDERGPAAASASDTGTASEPASATGEIEIAQAALEGEVDETETGTSDETASDEREPIEVEAEPQVGDHLEIEEVIEGEIIEIEVETVDAEIIEGEEPDEPDFDTLIRGR